MTWPTINAGLNATSALLLAFGFWSIRAKRIMAHTLCMVAAFVISTVFLISYLAYHAHVGVVRFPGTGWSRPLYLTILTSHTVLAVVILPLVLRTLFLAGHKRWPSHVAWARWTLPLWFYVSVTGVLVYWMLYHCPTVEACPACKEALFDPRELPQRLSMARGYALSIGLMLGVPLLLVGGVACLIVRAQRLHRN